VVKPNKTNILEERKYGSPILKNNIEKTRSLSNNIGRYLVIVMAKIPNSAP